MEMISRALSTPTTGAKGSLSADRISTIKVFACVHCRVNHVIKQVHWAAVMMYLLSSSYRSWAEPANLHYREIACRGRLNVNMIMLSPIVLILIPSPPPSHRCLIRARRMEMTGGHARYFAFLMRRKWVAQQQVMLEMAISLNSIPYTAWIASRIVHPQPRGVIEGNRPNGNVSSGWQSILSDALAGRAHIIMIIKLYPLMTGEKTENSKVISIIAKRSF